MGALFQAGSTTHPPFPHLPVPELTICYKNTFQILVKGEEIVANVVKIAPHPSLSQVRASRKFATTKKKEKKKERESCYS